MVVITGTDGYQAGIRQGRSNAFGYQHANDHNVGYRAVQLLIQDAEGPYFQNRTDLGDKPDLNRYGYTMKFSDGPDGQAIAGITASVQRKPDVTGRSPDTYDLGLVTAYCGNGTDPGTPGFAYPDGNCPNDLPVPFGKSTGGGGTPPLP